MKTRFTHARLDALPIPSEGRITYQDADVNGLQLRVTNTGAKTFSWYRRRPGGKAETVTIGRYPDVSINQARFQASELNARLAAGEAVKQDRAAITLGQLFDKFLINKRNNRGAYLSAKTRRNYLSDFKLHLAKYHDTKLSALSRAEVVALHATIGKQHPISANRVLALLSSLFNYAIDQGLASTNPVQRIRKFPETARTRFLQPDEIKRFFDAVDFEPNEDIRDFIYLCLFTGARKSNVLAMRWSDLNLDRREWCIPLTKNGEPQTVPLHDSVVEILHSRLAKGNPSPYVFPGAGRTGHLVSPDNNWNKIMLRAGIDDLTIHDLRRTLGSWQARIGSSLPIIGKSLGHKSPSSTLIYSRLDLAPVRDSVSRAIDAMTKAAKRS